MKSKTSEENFIDKNKKMIIFVVVAACMVSFLSFGLYHLSKFETVDEHFWKYKRISKYWRGVKLGITEGEWKKTRINDKPGVTVALISGMGLLFGPNPEEHQKENFEETQDLYKIYNHEITEKINFSLRFPILLIGTLLIPLFYWLIRQISHWKISLLATIFIASSPALIGISQIINPDSLYWSFGGLAIFSFFALLKKEEKKFLILTSVFTGLALLSKYTANILFIFYLLAIFSLPLFDKNKLLDSKNKINGYLKKQSKNFLIIFVSSVLIYGILLPASLDNLKYLYRGTVGSPTLEKINVALLIFLILIALDTYLLKSKIMHRILLFLRNIIQPIYLILLSFLVLLFVFILINPYLSNPIISLDDVKEISSVDGELTFPQIQQTPLVLKEIIKIATEFQPLIFSLPIVVIISLLSFWTIRIVKRKTTSFDFYFFVITVFSFIYFFGLLISDVMANPRYSIMLYVPFYFLGAVALYELSRKVKSKWVFPILLASIMIFGLFSLWTIKPFYLMYQNFLLPKNYTVTDSWGYGQYEAAEYLNSLENSEKLIVWADRPGICQFLKGKCIKSYKIDLSKTTPDYFVFSRRGSIRHRFKWIDPELSIRSKTYYYSPESEVVWELALGGREKNYIKIIKSEEVGDSNND